MSDKEITTSHKMEVAEKAEQTQTGPVFLPAVDIYESAEALTLMADMPGVDPEKLEIDLKENVLTIQAEAEPAMGADERPLLGEYAAGRYYRQFTLGQIIDQAGIKAKIKAGVLELTLPKVAKAQPRRIAVE